MPRKKSTIPTTRFQMDITEIDKNNIAILRDQFRTNSDNATVRTALSILSDLLVNFNALDKIDTEVSIMKAVSLYITVLNNMEQGDFLIICSRDAKERCKIPSEMILR